jgi:predicted ribosome quality control (RQC) complex YloA/Tae2 family protein
VGMDGLVVHQLVRELNGLLQNARLQRIQQPDRNTVHLGLRQPGVSYQLLLCADTSEPRLHLTDAEPPDSPRMAHSFCMVLRKHLEPARLLAVEQPGLERVITLRFEGRDESGQRVERWLTTELMGRHSNILLVDPASRTIIDGIRRVSAEKSRYREVYPGRPYLPPPPQDKEHPFSVTEERFSFSLRHTPAPMQIARALVNDYHGLGPDAARQVVAGAGLPVSVTRAELDPQGVRALWSSFCTVVNRAKTGDIEPWGVCDTQGVPVNFWFLPLTYRPWEGTTEVFESVNALVDWFFKERQEVAEFERMRSELLGAAKTALAKAERRLGIHQASLREAERAEDYRLCGELLLAHIHQIPKGAPSVIVPNYYEEGAKIQIELDPSLSAAANADKYFRKYHKARKTRQQAEQRLRISQDEVTYLRNTLDAVTEASVREELAEIGEDLKEQISVPGAQRTPKTERPMASHLTVTAPDGTEILVGKNQRQNDFITMKLARPDDLWVHAKDAAGAHVIVRKTGPEIAPDTLALALQFAALHSRARHSSLVPVDYCERRYVRKPRGAKPGFVIYDHHKTAYVTPDADELKRLLAD